jgi:hypothetical protein
VYPHIGDLTNLAGYPPSNQISSFVITSLTTTYVENGSSIQGRSQDGANIEEFKYLSKEKYFRYLPYSSPLCSRTSKRLSMGEEVGTMQFLEFKRGANKKNL